MPTARPLYTGHHHLTIDRLMRSQYEILGQVLATHGVRLVWSGGKLDYFRLVREICLVTMVLPIVESSIVLSDLFLHLFLDVIILSAWLQLLKNRISHIWLCLYSRTWGGPMVRVGREICGVGHATGVLYRTLI